MTGIRSFIIIVLIGMSALNNGKCLNDKEMTTANEFLISKWKLYYKSCDVNHDGIVNKKDVEESGNMFSDLAHLNGERRKIVTDVFTKYWDECILLGGKGDILEHEFVDSSECYFNTNAEEYVKERRRCFKLIMSAKDINEDKSISKEELQIARAAFGHDKLAKDDNNFSAYGPKDGLVPFHTMVDYWVDFLTSTNESKGNVIKSGFEVVGLD